VVVVTHTRHQVSTSTQAWVVVSEAVLWAQESVPVAQVHMVCPIINRTAKVSKAASVQAEVVKVRNLIFQESAAQEATMTLLFQTYNRTKLSEL